MQMTTSQRQDMLAGDTNNTSKIRLPYRLPKPNLNMLLPSLSARSREAMWLRHLYGDSELLGYIQKKPCSWVTTMASMEWHVIRYFTNEANTLVALDERSCSIWLVITKAQAPTTRNSIPI